jgi:hypothetical protein
MKYIILALTLLFLATTGCERRIDNNKQEWKSLNSQYSVGDTLKIEDIDFVSYRISYANEYTVTYVFEHPSRWIWLYITIDVHSKIIKVIRSTYDKP